ncbi:nitrilase-related carbon-nitrogen hydrolase, partial [Raoultella ornithinolytica]|uniref:nitrilase-related carbon-nitrogen hydrolase n=1 Tax=Raoultella ornithinolytica TaxID=54291 RepID=UPI00384C61A2
YHWPTLLAAGALDTTCYSVAAGECAPRNIGQSRIIAPRGTIMGGAGDEPQMITADISTASLRQIRERLPVLKNRRFAPPQLL